MIFFSEPGSYRIRASRIPGSVILALVAILLSSSFCGKATKKHSTSSTNDITNVIPKGWDGTSDWQGAIWTVNSAESKQRPFSLPLQRTSEVARVHGVCNGTPRLNDSGYLMKVRFYQGGEFHRLITIDKGFLSADLRPSPMVSEGLLRLHSVAEVEKIARLTHRHLGGGCAAIELIAESGEIFCDKNTYVTNGATNDALDMTPPVYDETINLSPVDELIKFVNEANIVSKMTALQNLETRYFAAANASAVSNYVKALFETAGSAMGSEFKVQQIQHSGIASSQPSIIATYEGSANGGETVIIGAHLDSINVASQNNAPGADDNASGVAILTEVIRIIAEQDAQFERKIEWHAYAAEEIGLVGSREIADQYAAEGRVVTAMMQLDMASFSAAGDSKIYLFRDDTTAGLRRSVKDLLTNYLGGNFSDEPISVAGTSDHKSWRDAGYPTVFPFENPLSYNPNMHTSNDTVDNANTPKLAHRMAQLVTAFLAHHAGLVSARDEYDSKFSTTERNADIKFAVLHRDEVHSKTIRGQLSANDTVVLFAVPENATVIESCGIAEGYNHQCGTDRLISTEIPNGPPGRRFFYSINSEAALMRAQRAFGYDVNNAPSLAREVSFSKIGD